MNHVKEALDMHIQSLPFAFIENKARDFGRCYLLH